MDFHISYVMRSTESIDGHPDYERLESTFTFPEGTPWMDVMDKFVKFVGACYGYDISDQVKYEGYNQRFEELAEDYPEILEDELDSQGREFN